MANNIFERTINKSNGKVSYVVKTASKKSVDVTPSIDGEETKTSKPRKRNYEGHWTTPGNILQIRRRKALDWKHLGFTEMRVMHFLDKGGKFSQKLFNRYAPLNARKFIDETGVTPNELYVWWKEGLDKMPICPICGNVVRLVYNFYELHTFCSSDCAHGTYTNEDFPPEKDNYHFGDAVLRKRMFGRNENQ